MIEQAPMSVNGKVPPRRVANAARRPREYLTADEVERLMAAARSRPSRYGQRDATMILLAYRHGLRVSELVGLRWDMLDLAQGHLHVQRLKNGRPSVHTVRGTELRALRRLQREQAPPSPYLFTTERRTPMSAAGFRKQLAVIGVAAELPFPIHPHMLRHACGFALAHGKHDTRAIQEWLGHRTSSTPPATPSSPPTASRTSGNGRTELRARTVSRAHSDPAWRFRPGWARGR